MIEQVFSMSKGEDKLIKRLIANEHVNINHMILNKGEGLPDHDSNASAYMHVLQGTVSIAEKQRVFIGKYLKDSGEHSYQNQKPP